jgi:hypothetical protein
MKFWDTVDEAGGVFRAEYPFRGNTINTVAVRVHGGLMVLSPGVGMEEGVFAELDQLGKVVALVSPGPFHHLGIPLWKERYPDARLFATTSGVHRIPKQHKGRIAGLEPVAALQSLLPPQVRVLEAEGMKHADVHVTVTSAAGCTWFANEVINNWQALPGGLFGLLMRWTNGGPGLRVSSLALLLVGGKKKPLGDFFRAELAAHPPTVLVPCHGAVDRAPELAARLLAEVDRVLV